MAMTDMNRCEEGLLTRPDTSTSELQARAERDGYLFVPGLIPSADVLELRREVTRVLARHGWLDPDRPMLDACIAPGMTPITEGMGQAYRSMYHDLQRLRALHALNLHPELVQFMERLFGEPCLPHPRSIARVIGPDSARHTTPPHQDYFYIRGCRDTWTVWVPLGDCDEDLGGLAIAPGTHLGELLPTHAAQGAGGRGVRADDCNWVWQPMRMGDVLLLHSHSIHQGRDNRTADRFRLSVDLRFQARTLPIHESSLQPHLHIDTWDGLYADWPSDDPIKYYWRDWPLQVTG